MLTLWACARVPKEPEREKEPKKAGGGCARLNEPEKGGIPTDIDDPLEVFDATDVTDVSKDMMRFVVYILWLKRQPNSFEEYLCVRELRFDLWRDCVYKLWRL